MPSLAPEAERLLADASPLVRGAAVWALGRLDPAAAGGARRQRTPRESRRRGRRGMGRRRGVIRVAVIGLLPTKSSATGRTLMAALTRRTMLAGLSAAAVLRPDRAFAAWPRAQHFADPRPDRWRRRRCQRARDRRGPVAASSASRSWSSRSPARPARSPPRRWRAPRPTATLLQWLPSGYAVSRRDVQVAAVPAARRFHRSSARRSNSRS